MFRVHYFRGDCMNIFQRYLAEEFAEDYEEGRLSCREAMKLILSVTGSLIAANSILAGCASPSKSTETVRFLQRMPQPLNQLNRVKPHRRLNPFRQRLLPLQPHTDRMPDDPAVIASEVKSRLVIQTYRLSGKTFQSNSIACHFGLP